MIKSYCERGSQSLRGNSLPSYIIFTTQVVYFRMSVHFSRKSYFLHRGVYLPNKLYILVVSSIFFTISDIFFSISCIFPKISSMYLLHVLDILQQVFLPETVRHSFLYRDQSNFSLRS